MKINNNILHVNFYLFAFLPFIWLMINPLSNEAIAQADRYNNYQAIRYAERWWNSSNSNFNFYDDDCANFVSQCLIAGGFNLYDNDEHYYVVEHAIIRCDDLHRYLSNESKFFTMCLCVFAF